MRFLFFIVMIVFTFGVNSYVIYRLVCLLPAVPFARGVVLVLTVSGVLFFLASHLVGDYLPVAVTSFMHKIGSSWFFMSFYFFILFLVLDILRLTPLPIDKILYRDWLSFAVITGVVSVTMLWGYLNYQKKERVELDLFVDKTSELSGGLRIVAISDLHLGYGTREKEFSSWVGMINKENPDIVLIAGDAIDNSMRPIREGHFDEVFRDIKSKYGTYMVLGNHEYISGVDDAVEYLENTGVNILRDKAVLIDGKFYLVGREDRTNPARKRLADLTESLDKTKPVIVMDHQPFALEEVPLSGADLQLSGHTHHGQVWPISWITEAIYEKAHGYLLKGDSHIYVSSGIGLWGGKFRIGTRSEYVVVNMSFAGG